MKKTLRAAAAALALSASFTVDAQESGAGGEVEVPEKANAGVKPKYLSDWWHQSVNLVGSYFTRFGPQHVNDVYLEYEAFAKKDWLDFYGYIDIPNTFGVGNDNAKGIWNDGSPLFTEIEPRFSLNYLTKTDLSFGPFKEWYFANNIIYDVGGKHSNGQFTWYMGLGTDINTGLPIGLQLDAYAKYQGENYGASNEYQWDGYRVKVKAFVPITHLWGGQLMYVGFTNFDFASSLGRGNFLDQNGNQARTNNSIASSHALALNYDHWHFSVLGRWWHNGGQWNEGAQLNFGAGDFTVNSTGWGGYLIAGYSF